MAKLLTSILLAGISTRLVPPAAEHRRHAAARKRGAFAPFAPPPDSDPDSPAPPDPRPRGAAGRGGRDGRDGAAARTPAPAPRRALGSVRGRAVEVAAANAGAHSAPPTPSGRRAGAAAAR